MPVVLTGIGYWLFSQPDVDILPYARVVSDQDEGGQSMVEMNRTDQGLEVHYTLKPGSKYPFTGVQFPFSLEAAIDQLVKLDMTYRTVVFDLETDRESMFPIRITVDLPGYTKYDTELTFLYLQEAFGFDQGLNHFELPARQLDFIPEWWYAVNGINQLDALDYDLANAVNVTVFNDPKVPLGETSKMVFKRLAIVTDYYYFWVWSLALSLVYYTVLAFAWRKQRLRTVLMPVAAQPIQQPEALDPTALIIHYIGENYQHPDLKLNDVAKAAHISDREVSEVLKRHCEMTFKTYLNTVRIAAAKTLLKQSPLQISQVGYEVGYNSPQHFARVFHDMVGKSASEFRLERSDN